MRSFFVKAFGVVLGGFLVALGYFWFPTHVPFKPLDLKSPISVAFVEQFMAHRAPDPTKNQIPPELVMMNDGAEQSLKSVVKGKWTVLNLWATWCAPCVAELPSLAKLQDHYRGQLNVLALSFDNNTDIKKLSNFMAKNGAQNLTFAYDHRLKVRTLIETNGLPTSLILDPNGKIIVILEGHIDWTSDKALSFFDQIVTKS